MYSTVKLYSNKDGEIFNFLSKYHKTDDVSYKKIQDLDVYLHSLEWEKQYKNPVEIATVLGVFADNIDKFELAMWICLDKGYYINITPHNADSIIRYLYERYPY